MVAGVDYVAAAMVGQLEGEMGSFSRDQIEKRLAVPTTDPHDSVTVPTTQNVSEYVSEIE